MKPPPLGGGFIPGEISTQIDGLVAVVDVVGLHRRSGFLPEHGTGTSHRIEDRTTRIRNIRRDGLLLSQIIFGEFQP
jgi:hypothetical protein